MLIGNKKYILIIILCFLCGCASNLKVKPDAEFGWELIFAPAGTKIDGYTTRKDYVCLSDELFLSMLEECIECENERNGNKMWVKEKE